MFGAISVAFNKFTIAAARRARLQSFGELDEAERIKFETMIAAMERAAAVRAAAIDLQGHAAESAGQVLGQSAHASA